MPDDFSIKIAEIPLGRCTANPHSATLNDLEQVVAFASFVKNAAPWWLGDIINYAEHRFGDQGWQAAALQGVSLASIHRYAAVARKVPAERRVASLSWTHHACVANLAPPVQIEYLAKAAEEGMSSGEFQKWIRSQQCPSQPATTESTPTQAKTSDQPSTP